MHTSLLQIRSKGFTIVELLVVIVVIGILAASVVFAYSGIQGRARDKAVLSDIEGVESEITRYGTQNSGVYGTAVAWYSPAGANSNLKFSVTSGTIVDAVATVNDYCIRAYNPQSTTYKTLSTAAKKGSSPTACDTLSPSSQALAAS